MIFGDYNFLEGVLYNIKEFFKVIGISDLVAFRDVLDIGLSEKIKR